MAKKRERPRALRWVMVLGLVALVATGVVLADIRPDKSHLQIKLLSGPASGGYRSIADRLSKRGAADGAAIEVVITEGTLDNLERLAKGCDAHFALVQDGIPSPKGRPFENIARLEKSESLVLLGKGASSLRQLADLRGKRIGVGPQKGGTSHAVRELFADRALAKLGVKLVNHGLTEQLDLAQRGELDLAAMVIDEDAALLRSAVLDRGLELAPLEHLDVIARRYQHLWHGRIGAGQFDPVALVPPSDVRVLRVDTMIVGNGCASHAETAAFLTLLSDELPGLVEHNRRRGGGALPRSATARAFYVNGGPNVADVHLPWLVDILPPSQWLYLVTAVSVLFNVMGFGHRFRLWRLDTARVALDREIREVVGADLTDEELHDLTPREEHLRPEVYVQLKGLHEEQGRLLDRCRKHAVSMLVPMGQEMTYRYQEDAIETSITSLRLFLERLASQLSTDDPEDPAPAAEA